MGHSPADFLSAKEYSQRFPSKRNILRKWCNFKANVKEQALSCAAELGLPSWVPHWTRSGGAGVETFGFNTSYENHEPPELHNDTNLNVVSKTFDRIVYRSEEFDGYQAWTILRSAWQAKILTEAQQHMYPDGSSMDDAFLRTLMEDHWPAMAFSRATEADVALADAVLQEVLSTKPDLKTDDLNTDANRLKQRKISQKFGAIRRKTFFITEKGYYGLGTGDVQISDEVHILVGANYPFMLRPVSSQTSSSKSTEPLTYEMVERYYLHGIIVGD
jgi:hypothetical protein